MRPGAARGCHLANPEGRDRRPPKSRAALRFLKTEGTSQKHGAFEADGLRHANICFKPNGLVSHSSRCRGVGACPRPDDAAGMPAPARRLCGQKMIDPSRESALSLPI